MSFPTTGILDSGPGDDASPVIDKWSAVVNDAVEGAGQQRLTGHFRCINFVFPNGSWYDLATFGPDTESRLKVNAKGNGAISVYLYARLQTPGTNGMDGYMARIDGATLRIYRVIDRSTTGSGGQINTDETITLNDGDGFGMEVTGTGATVTVQCYRDDGYTGTWATLGTAATDTDANRIVSAGYIGFGAQDDTSMTFDGTDFGGGTVVEGGSPATVTWVGYIG